MKHFPIFSDYFNKTSIKTLTHWYHDTHENTTLATNYKSRINIQIILLSIIYDLLMYKFACTLYRILKCNSIRQLKNSLYQFPSINSNIFEIFCTALYEDLFKKKVVLIKHLLKIDYKLVSVQNKLEFASIAHIKIFCLSKTIKALNRNHVNFFIVLKIIRKVSEKM